VRKSFFGINWLLPAMLSLYALLYCATQRHYGLTWDSALGEFYIGDKNLAFFRTFNPDYLDYAKDNLSIYRDEGQPDYFSAAGWGRAHPEQVWPLGPTLSALSRELLFTKAGLLDAVDAQHFFLLPMMLLLFVAVFIFVTRHWGPLAGYCAVLFLAVHPQLWAHAHNNIKDIPSLVFFTLSMELMAEACLQQRRALFAAGSVAWGLALAAKANALFLPCIILPWLVVSDIKPKLKLAGALVISTIPALLICFALSPYLWLDFPSHLRKQLDYIVEYGSAGEAGFHLLPAVEAVVTTPFSFLLFFLAGCVFLLRKTEEAEPRPSLFLLLLIWLIFPVLRVSLPFANDFDGIRHWLEFLLPLSILSGIGLSIALQKCSGMYIRGSLLLILAFWPVLRWEIRNHPFELCFYNSLIGGLPGARERNMPQAGDYWGSTYRPALQWINAHAEPGAQLTTGVAEHIVQATDKIWLRPDIRLKPTAELQADFESGNTSRGGSERYLLYITRTERYPDVVRFLDGLVQPVYELKVEGTAIVKILRLPDHIPQLIAASRERKVSTFFSRDKGSMITTEGIEW
jgi:hypothetical protein